MKRLAIRLYACLLNFYPRSYRAKFADELQDVFAEAATEAHWERSSCAKCAAY